MDPSTFVVSVFRLAGDFLEGRRLRVASIAPNLENRIMVIAGTLLIGPTHGRSVSHPHKPRSLPHPGW